MQFREAREQNLLDFHTLSSFLITPIQRIPRYLLLLREYEKTMNERQFSAELESARRASAKLQDVASSLDGVTKNSSESMLLLEMISKLSSEHKEVINLEDVVASGPIRLRAEDGRGGLIPLFCILTRDILFGCESKKDKVTIEWAVCLLNSTVSTVRGEALPPLRSPAPVLCAWALHWSCLREYLLLATANLLQIAPRGPRLCCESWL